VDHQPTEACDQQKYADQHSGHDSLNHAWSLTGTVN
jgi:hypothetical protein